MGVTKRATLRRISGFRPTAAHSFSSPHIMPSAKTATKAAAAGASKGPPSLTRADSVVFSAGDAHQAFEAFANWQKVPGKKKATQAKERVLSKPMLHGLVTKMNTMKHIRFASTQKMKAWVDDAFEKYDTDKNGYLTLEEFTSLYREYLTQAPENDMQTLARTQSELERLFVTFDDDASFGLAKEELVKLMRSKDQKGYPPPSDEKLTELADALFDGYDADKNGNLDFDEFCEAYNKMVDDLAALHEEIRHAVLSGANLGGMCVSSRLDPAPAILHLLPCLALPCPALPCFAVLTLTAVGRSRHQDQHQVVGRLGRSRDRGAREAHRREI